MLSIHVHWYDHSAYPRHTDGWHPIHETSQLRNQYRRGLPVPAQFLELCFHMCSSCSGTRMLPTVDEGLQVPERCADIHAGPLHHPRLAHVRFDPLPERRACRADGPAHGTWLFVCSKNVGGATVVAGPYGPCEQSTDCENYMAEILAAKLGWQTKQRCF